MHADSSIPVVILAGGAGVRIGGNKESRMLGGKALLARSLEKASTYSSQIAVSTNKLSQHDLPKTVFFCLSTIAIITILFLAYLLRSITPPRATPIMC